MLEVELKVRIPSPGPVRERLVRMNAESRGRVHEHDVYYNAPHRDFAVTDEAVRVRYGNGRAVVTYKGPKIRSYGLKAREELNIAVESGESFEQMLMRLGFTRTLTVDKERETYRLGAATVSLDEVEGLGTFAEIEVIAREGAGDPAAAIGQIAREIGVEGEPILASYLELLLAAQAPVKGQD